MRMSHSVPTAQMMRMRQAVPPADGSEAVLTVSERCSLAVRLSCLVAAVESLRVSPWLVAVFLR